MVDDNPTIEKQKNKNIKLKLQKLIAEMLNNNYKFVAN